jgi:hypothetical protein
MSVKLIKTKELCDMLGVTRQCIYKWRNLEYDPMPVAVNNTMKHTARGRGKTLRYDLGDVLDWLNSNGKEERASKVSQEGE